MKTIIKIASIVGSLLLTTSCVSFEEFTKLQNENENNKDQLTSLQQKNSDLTKANDDLKSKLATEKDQNEKERTMLKINEIKNKKDQETLSELRREIQLERREVGNIRQEICDALKCFTPDELTIEERNGQLYVTMYDKLLFPTGVAIVNNRGKEALKLLSEVLKKNSKIQIMVEGHTDAVPINNKHFQDNWDLSVIRATNVTRILTKYDVAPNRIIAAGRSKYEPFDSNDTEKGRRLNRRTDIVLIPKLDQLYSLINQDNNDNNTASSNSNNRSKSK